MRTRILGLGHYLPPEADAAGVRRPLALDPVGSSTLAVEAARGALAQARVGTEAVDFIVFATMTPDANFPGSGCFFQEQMGCGTVGALDVRAQCAGFLFGLSIAEQFVGAGVYERVLVAGAEVHSAGLDYSEPRSAVARLYGDGAGVALVGPGDDGVGVRGTVIHTDGRHYREFWCEYPSSRQHPTRMTLDDFHAGRHFLTLDVERVRRFGEDTLPTVIHESLAKAGVAVAGVDRFIIGHVLPEVAESVARGLGIEGSRLNVPAARHGHLTAAALPVALSEEVARGSLAAGATVCLAACGAGFAWGATVITL
jgi:3-oxoacyl-[acyl-carrier-protein] synthase III